MELLCRTRIIQNDSSKKLIISDDEYKSEYKRISGIIAEGQKSNSDAKHWLRNSVDFRTFKKTKSIVFSDVNASSKRSSSMFEVLTPVLSHREVSKKGLFRKRF